MRRLPHSEDPKCHAMPDPLGFLVPPARRRAIALKRLSLVAALTALPVVGVLSSMQAIVAARREVLLGPLPLLFAAFLASLAAAVLPALYVGAGRRLLLTVPLALGVGLVGVSLPQGIGTWVWLASLTLIGLDAARLVWHARRGGEAEPGLESHPLPRGPRGVPRRHYAAVAARDRRLLPLFALGAYLAARAVSRLVEQGAPHPAPSAMALGLFAFVTGCGLVAIVGPALYVKAPRRLLVLAPLAALLLLATAYIPPRPGFQATDLLPWLAFLLPALDAFRVVGLVRRAA